MRNSKIVKKNDMPSEARQKKIMEKLDRAQKCSILEPRNLGSRGTGSPGLLWIRTGYSTFKDLNKIKM